MDPRPANATPTRGPRVIPGRANAAGRPPGRPPGARTVGLDRLSERRQEVGHRDAAERLPAGDHHAARVHLHQERVKVG
jgi:hypothetical protein